MEMVNDTAPSRGEAPAKGPPHPMLDSLIPGYSIIIGVLSEIFGVDFNKIVSLCILLAGTLTSARYLWGRVEGHINEHFRSQITVYRYDEIHDSILNWIAEQNLCVGSRDLIVEDGNEKEFDVWSNSDHGDDPDDESDDFARSEKHPPPMYRLSYGAHQFFWAGNLFTLFRDNDRQNKITLSCYGRSTAPLKSLVSEVFRASSKKRQTHTSVRRASAPRNGNSSVSWERSGSILVRPLHTVSLDQGDKRMIIRDIKTYLSHRTRTWYANRGVPHRRGYLLYGAPGTGKTSFATAVAGHFGLDIYCLTLADSSITDSQLAKMFSNLSKKCVVLLEDIDAAGLERRHIGKTSSTSGKKKGSKDSKTQGITLSGLLNAIDGVGSDEGRVLLMTTNCPDDLDEALVRPGRIDMMIEFKKASSVQIREIFMRIYSPDETVASLVAKRSRNEQTGRSSDTVTAQAPAASLLTFCHWILGLTPFSGAGANQPAVAVSKEPSKSAIKLLTWSKEELEAMATRFAELLPEKEFTPAELQGFLLTRKDNPQQALAEVENWRDDFLKAREDKTRREKERKEREALGLEEPEETSEDESSGEDAGVDTEQDTDEDAIRNSGGETDDDSDGSVSGQD